MASGSECGSGLKEAVRLHRSLRDLSSALAGTVNYSKGSGDVYGSRNVQLEAFLSRSDYSLVPNRLVGSYCFAYRSCELDRLVLQFVAKQTEFQMRLSRTNPHRKKAKKRLVFGMEEIKKYLDAGKVISLIVATNLEQPVVDSTAYKTVVEMAQVKAVPLVFACSRGQLGGCLCERVAVGMIAVVNDESLRELHQKITALSQELAEGWRKDVVKSVTGMENPYSSGNESALFIASFYGQIELARELLGRFPKLSFHVENSNGMLPVHVGVSAGHLECTRLLLLPESRSFRNELVKAKTFQLKDAAYLAVESNSRPITRLLLEELLSEERQSFLKRLATPYATGYSLISLAISKSLNQSLQAIVEALEGEQILVPFPSIIEYFKLAAPTRNTAVWQSLFRMSDSFELDRFLGLEHPLVDCLRCRNIHGARLFVSFLKRKLSPEKQPPSLGVLLGSITVEGESIAQMAQSLGAKDFINEFKKYQ